MWIVSFVIVLSQEKQLEMTGVGNTSRRAHSWDSCTFSDFPFLFFLLFKTNLKTVVVSKCTHVFNIYIRIYNILTDLIF